MALSRNRIIGNLASAIDSASQNSFLSKASQDGEYKSLAYSDLSGAPTVLDSAGISAVIDSSYTQLRITPATGPTKSVDSAVVTSLIDSNYVTNRAAAASNTGFTTYNYTATAGQTTFQDSDLSGNILSYTSGGTMVWMNGVMLKETADWTGTDGSSIVLDSAANAGAKITIAKWNVLASSGAGGAAAWYGDRGLFGGGRNSSGTYLNTIDYITIASTGNATDFGDLTATRNRVAQASDATYGVWAGGATSVSDGEFSNVIDYVTISTTGNATDFGDLSAGFIYHGNSGCGDGTYGLFSGGNKQGIGINTIIEYVTIASPGNSTDFGDLTVARLGTGSFNDATYACWAGGNSSGNTIDYVTMASPGNATDFGDLTAARNYGGGTGDTTYGLIGGGQNPNASSIDYVTIATPGNASDFGDLTVGRRYLNGCSDATYGVFGGGEQNDSPYSVYNVMDYVTIASPGNATDFGDLTSSRYGTAALSGSPS